jgi:parallel beta-helix repeat protein
LLATLYVATTGSDSNPGTSDAPWRTLQYAVDTIRPGDTILVRPGTYAGFRVGKSGTATAPKVIQAENNAKVLVNQPGSANRHQSNIEVELFDSIVTDWVIDGFEVANSPRHGIDVRGTSRIVIQNNYVHHSVYTGIFTAFSNAPRIERNHSESNGEHGIYHSNSADYPVVHGNILHHNYGSGIHMNGDISMKPGDGLISFALIENNIIYENGRGGGSAINLDGVMDSTIRNNLAYNNHASGISLFAIDGAAGSSRNRVYNNTFVMASDSRWVVNIPSSPRGKANPTGNQVQNNILYTPRTDRGSILTYGTAVPGFVSDNNVVVNRFTATGGKKVLSLTPWQGLGYDKQSFIATPSELFVDPVRLNFRLKAGSRAIDVGATLAQVATDLEGVVRPQGTGFDIGCYEYRTPTLALLATASPPLTSTGSFLAEPSVIAEATGSPVARTDFTRNALQPAPTDARNRPTLTPLTAKRDQLEHGALDHVLESLDVSLGAMSF